MIVRDFLNWADHAPEAERASAAHALATSFLAMDRGSDAQREASAALTFLLDDPSPMVRRALADALAASPHAPAYVIRSLAADLDTVAGPILRATPLLSEAELVDLLAEGSVKVQTAIAGRANLSPALAAAISEVGEEEACAALLRNSGATILASSVQRLAERFSEEAEIRDLLLKRKDLALAWRYSLLMALAGKLEDHPVVLERVPAHRRDSFLSDACDKVVLRLALEGRDEELPAFVEFLRDNGKLTTRLLLRAVCCGRLRLFAAALAVLGRVPLPRLRKVLVSVRPAALQAVLRKAGLPHRAHQAFVLAIDIARNADADFSRDLPLDEARRLTETLLAEMQDEALAGDEDVTAFLRQFAIEVARLEARAVIKNAHQKLIAAA